MAIIVLDVHGVLVGDKMAGEIYQQNEIVTRKRPYLKLFALIFVIIATVVVLILIYKPAKPSEYICLESSYYQCLAIQQKDITICDNLEDYREGCRIAYYMTLASFEQNEQLCDNLDTELRATCKFLVSQDISKCPEDNKGKCDKMLNFDINKGVDIESMSDEDKELWDMQVTTIALQTKDLPLCDKIINAKKNFMDNLRCELLLKGKSAEFCRSRLNEYCLTEPDRFKK